MDDNGKDLKKVGVYMDDATWEEMKEYTFRKHGTTRELSGEVRELIRANLPLRVIKKGVDGLDIPTSRMSPKEIREGRPKMRTSSADIVREMRARR